MSGMPLAARVKRLESRLVKRIEDLSDLQLLLAVYGRVDEVGGHVGDAIADLHRALEKLRAHMATLPRPDLP
jgi:hypothetical protein